MVTAYVSLLLLFTCLHETWPTYFTVCLLVSLPVNVQLLLSCLLAHVHVRLSFLQLLHLFPLLFICLSRKPPYHWCCVVFHLMPFDQLLPLFSLSYPLLKWFYLDILVYFFNLRVYFWYVFCGRLLMITALWKCIYNLTCGQIENCQTDMKNVPTYEETTNYNRFGFLTGVSPCSLWYDFASLA